MRFQAVFFLYYSTTYIKRERASSTPHKNIVFILLRGRRCGRSYFFFFLFFLEKYIFTYHGVHGDREVSANLVRRPKFLERIPQLFDLMRTFLMMRYYELPFLPILSRPDRLD